jgi:hypothetical protein
LPFLFRLRKGKAEGGGGGNSAFPLRNQIEASPATCLNTWKAEHRRKTLFSLEEKEIGRAQNEKSKEYFSVVWRACRAVAGLASLLGVLLKKSSNINQKTPQKIRNKNKRYFMTVFFWRRRDSKDGGAKPTLFLKCCCRVGVESSYERSDLETRDLIPPSPHLKIARSSVLIFLCGDEQDNRLSCERDSKRFSHIFERFLS